MELHYAKKETYSWSFFASLLTVCGVDVSYKIVGGGVVAELMSVKEEPLPASV